MIAILGAVGVFFVFSKYSVGLPEYAQLADYEPPTVTRVHAGDGQILAEYAIERRVFVPESAMPRRVINAFLAAEDKNFYHHPGVDFVAVARAAVSNFANYLRGRRPVGASTITQQVAKNFLLTNEVSYERKIKEAILAFRIEEALSKDRILELYLNEIYLGYRSYGVAAAALNYFNKSLDELTVAEAAYLAALPKAPNNYHPIRRHDAAVARRNWVIGRMVEDGYITPEAAEAAKAESLVVRPREELEEVHADYFAEEVRRELVDLYGEDGLYEGGLSVRTTLDPRLQDIARRSLRQGLIDYDRRHGWRGPLGQLDLAAAAEIETALGPGWVAALDDLPVPEGVDGWSLAVVLEVGKSAAEIGLRDGSKGRIPLSELTWARPWEEEQEVGPAPKSAGEVLSAGDVVLVAPAEADAEGKAYPEGSYSLQQIPEVNGGLIAMDPHTGRVLAMSGGFSYARSEFNRATQALRQPGSAFKPFVYLAGLDSGFTPATLILDAPFVIDQGEGQGKWKPDNYTKKFYGPTRMRVGIERSRNLMTVRLAQTIGMEKVAEYAERFGIVDHMPRVLAMSLGAGETTLIRLATAYAMLVNGGRRIGPAFIDRVQDRNGVTIFRHDTRDCPGCLNAAWYPGEEAPQLPDPREQIADPASIYQVVSMLQGVVQRGTGRRIAELGRPLAGKTGTTNDYGDAWFMGFSPDLVVGVFVGFDVPRTLGPKEAGSAVAAPIFKSFMAEALENQPIVPFRTPPGIQLVRINADTGQLAQSGDRHVFLEAFKPGTVPRTDQQVLGGGGVAQNQAQRAQPAIQQPRTSGSSTGGLY